MNNQTVKEFRILYNRLDEALAQKANVPIRVAFTHKLSKFIKHYPSFENIRNEAKLIHDFRNILVHEEKYKDSIAIPTEEFLKRIKDLITRIENPQTAIDIASINIFSCQPDDQITDIVSVMAEKLYTQVPVFENKENLMGFIGVFSDSCLVTLIHQKGVTKDDHICIEDSKAIRDIIEVVQKPITQSWDFIAKDTDVYKIQHMFHTKTFEGAELENSRLGVLFVTESGQKDERMLGIITAWDLSKIDQSKS